MEVDPGGDGSWGRWILGEGDPGRGRGILGDVEVDHGGCGGRSWGRGRWILEEMDPGGGGGAS